MQEYPPSRWTEIALSRKFTPTRSLPWVNHPVAAKVALTGTRSFVLPFSPPRESVGLISHRCATALGLPTLSPSRDGLHPLYSGSPARRLRAAVAAPRGGEGVQPVSTRGVSGGLMASLRGPNG